MRLKRKAVAVAVGGSIGAMLVWWFVPFGVAQLDNVRIVLENPPAAFLNADRDTIPELMLERKPTNEEVAGFVRWIETDQPPLYSRMIYVEDNQLALLLAYQGLEECGAAVDLIGAFMTIRGISSRVRVNENCTGRLTAGIRVRIKQDTLSAPGSSRRSVPAAEAP